MIIVRETAQLYPSKSLKSAEAKVKVETLLD